MDEVVAVDLTYTLAERVSLMRMAEQLMLGDAANSLTYLRKEDRITVQCSVGTALKLAGVLQDCIAADGDRDQVIACGVVMKKLNAALDTCLNKPATDLSPSERGKQSQTR